MNRTLRVITILLAAGTILASTGTWAPAQQSEPTLVVPFGRNKELAPAHDVYKFPYKENYIMLPLTNGTMVTEDGGMRVIVNKPVQLNKRRATVIPLGHGAPNISPTPVVPQGFNGGNIAKPVNRPEGVVVRRIYPQQQEYVTTVESAPVVQTYEEPPAAERTEALPSVVLKEDSNSGLSQEHSIVSQVPAAPAETPLSAAVDGTQTTPSPYETSTPSEYGTQSGTYTSPDYGTPSGTYTSPDYGTPSGTYTSPEYGTPSGTYTSPDYGTQSGTSTPSEYGTPSSAYTSPEYGTPSEPSTPSDYGTPSGTSTDPYQPNGSSETIHEVETPTSAWRSTTSNPAETYDSGMSGESPMVMTKQESNQSSNSWETQSSKPQFEETASPVVAIPSSQTAQTSQTPALQNSASAPSGTRYVEVRPRRQSANRVPQNRNSGTVPAQVPSVSSPGLQSAPQSAPLMVPQPSTQSAPQYQPQREIPAQLPPPDPEKQAPKPSADGRKV